MLEPEQIIAVATAAFALAVIPGPDTMLIVGRSLSNGRRIGLATSTGVALGMLFHTTLATVGLSALLMTSSLAFNGIKWLGVLYLLFLGVQNLLSKTGSLHSEAEQLKTLSFQKAFGQAALTNVFNPKAALFFLAFLPQFVRPANSHVTLQFLFLGCIVTAVCLFWDSLIAVTAGSFGVWLGRNATFVRWQKRVMGTIFLGLGLRLALQNREHTP
jgi:threonine/homoserine/homoserine lactone efflux protein